jgi:hypothetical protein
MQLNRPDSHVMNAAPVNVFPVEDDSVNARMIEKALPA